MQKESYIIAIETVLKVTVLFQFEIKFVFKLIQA